MRRIKILTVMLAVMLAGVCIFGGCSREWEVYTGEAEGGPLYSLEEIYEARAIRWRDFLNIAYHNGDIERNRWLLQNFEPEPIGELNEETALKSTTIVIRRRLRRTFLLKYISAATMGIMPPAFRIIFLIIRSGR